MNIKVKVVKPKRGNLVLRWVSPDNGRVCERSAGTMDRRDADRKAGQLQAELESGRYVKPTRMLWAEFRTRYENEKMATLAGGKKGRTCYAFNHFERLINPKFLANATTSSVSQFQTALRKEGMKETTIASHLRCLKAALRWAHTMGFLNQVPVIQIPRPAKGQRLMRGRPLAAEEFERMLAVVPKVRPHDSLVWERFLTGLWLSGLRLGEAVCLSWEPDAALFVDLGSKHPQLRIYAEAEKGRRDRKLPLTPDFAQWLLQTPQNERSGFVFPLPSLRRGEAIERREVGKIVSQIGRKAGIIVNKADNKFASAHDLRRSFGARWAKRVMPAVLQKLMRHSAIETTLRYYADLDADDLAADLWREYAPVDSQLCGGQTMSSESGGILGGTRPMARNS